MLHGKEASMAGHIVNCGHSQAYFFHGVCKVCDLCSTEWLRNEVWDCVVMNGMIQAEQM